MLSHSVTDQYVGTDLFSQGVNVAGQVHGNPVAGEVLGGQHVLEDGQAEPVLGVEQQVLVGGHFQCDGNGLEEQCGGQSILSLGGCQGHGGGDQGGQFGDSGVMKGYVQGENQVLLEQERVGLGGYQVGSLSARSSGDLFMRRDSSSWDFLGPTFSSPSATSDNHSEPYHSSSQSSWSPLWVWQVGTSPQCAPAYCGQCGLWGTMSLVRLG